MLFTMVKYKCPKCGFESDEAGEHCGVPMEEKKETPQQEQEEQKQEQPTEEQPTEEQPTEEQQEQPTEEQKQE